MSAPVLLSASQVDTYRTCSLKWHYRHVEHAEEEQRGAALVVGTVVDVAIKGALLDLKDGLVRVEELAPDTYFERAWQAELASTPVPVQWGKGDEASAAQTAQALVRRFLEREDLAEYVRSVHAVDLAFELPVLDPDTARDTGVSLRGILDLVVRDEKGWLKVLDLKTSASRAGWSAEELRFHLQGCVYSWALPQIVEQGVSDEVLFDVGLKLKTPIWERHAVVLGEDAQRRALKTVLAAHRGMELGVALPTPNWGCPTCPYARRCATWQDAVLAAPAPDAFAAEVLSDVQDVRRQHASA